MWGVYRIIEARCCDSIRPAPVKTSPLALFASRDFISFMLQNSANTKVVGLWQAYTLNLYAAVNCEAMRTKFVNYFVKGKRYGLTAWRVFRWNTQIWLLGSCDVISRIELRQTPNFKCTLTLFVWIHLHHRGTSALMLVISAAHCRRALCISHWSA